MLPYLLTHTVPAIVLLWFVVRPLLSRADVMKMSLISTAAALVYATVCGGHAQTSDVVSTAAQVVLTLLWSPFCFRWSTPCLHFNFDGPSYRLVRWVPIWMLGVIVAAAAYASRHSAEQDAVAVPLLCWSFPAVAFLWYGAGNYFVARLVPSALAIAMPTVYLCLADDWLPSDNARFFRRFAVNALLVLAVVGFDKAIGLMDTYTTEFPRQFGYDLGYATQLFSAFVTAECSMPVQVVDDIRACFRVIEQKSTTFSAALPLFQGGTRLDMLIVYSFGRVTDEMIDNDVGSIKQQRDLKLCYEFINKLFADRKTTFHVKRKPEVIKIDWTKFESQFNDTEVAVFRAFARIAFYLPAAPFMELFDGFQRDVEDKVYETEEELIRYTENIGGINAAVDVFCIMYRDYNNKYYDFVEKGKKDIIIQKLYKIGQTIQLVNMARDIVTDSLRQGRCYIPLEYIDDENVDMKILRQVKNPRSLGDSKLKRYANMFINLANKFYAESEDVIRSLPIESRGLIIAYIDMYRGYISAIQSGPIYPTRAKLSQWKKIKITLYSLYIRSLRFII